MSTIQLVSRIIEISPRLVTQPMDVHTLPLERFYPAWHESAEVGADDSHQVSAGMYFLHRKFRILECGARWRPAAAQHCAAVPVPPKLTMHRSQ